NGRRDRSGSSRTLAACRDDARAWQSRPWCAAARPSPLGEQHVLPGPLILSGEDLTMPGNNLLPSTESVAMFPARSLLALILCSFLLPPPPVLAQAKTKAQPGKVLTLEDLYRLDHPQTPVLSPDGKRLAYIRHWFDGTGKQERHSLCLVDRSPEKAKPLEAGE